MKQNPYMATVLPGLEHVLADEIGRKIADADSYTIERGKVLFRSALPAGQLQCLRTADNLYLMLGAFRVGPHRTDLPELERSVAALDLSIVRPFAGASAPYVVNASRRGRHTYSRFEAAEAAMRGIARQYPRWPRGGAEHHGAEFRLDLAEEEALFSFRLTDASYRFRGHGRRFSAASLRPTVAHALVWLSSPDAADRFLDPCCGSGTILAERLAYPSAEIRGGDLSAEAVLAARSNCGVAAAERCSVQQWDARRLPLAAGSVSAVVSNLPFGRQIGERGELGPLYRELLRELARVLAPGGRAILLAEDSALLRQAAERCGLSCGELARLSLKGLQPAVYKLQK